MILMCDDDDDDESHSHSFDISYRSYGFRRIFDNIILMIFKSLKKLFLSIQGDHLLRSVYNS